jgi:hypothetical protein
MLLVIVKSFTERVRADMLNRNHARSFLIVLWFSKGFLR